MHASNMNDSNLIGSNRAENFALQVLTNPVYNNDHQLLPRNLLLNGKTPAVSTHSTPKSSVPVIHFRDSSQKVNLDENGGRLTERRETLAHATPGHRGSNGVPNPNPIPKRPLSTSQKVEVGPPDDNHRNLKFSEYFGDQGPIAELIQRQSLRQSQRFVEVNGLPSTSSHNKPGSTDPQSFDPKNYETRNSHQNEFSKALDRPLTQSLVRLPSIDELSKHPGPEPLRHRQASNLRIEFGSRDGSRLDRRSRAEYDNSLFDTSNNASFLFDRANRSSLRFN